MGIPATNATPSDLADVLQQVADVFQLTGNAATFQVGKKYLDTVGAAPRVLFVPETGAGKLGPPIDMGDAASVYHSCELRVRSAAQGSDIDRFRGAYALVKLCADYLETAATGRLEWGKLKDVSPTDTDNFGVELSVAFICRFDVAHDPSRWALAPAATDASGAVSAPPTGTVSPGATLTPSTVPVNAP